MTYGERHGDEGWTIPGEGPELPLVDDMAVLCPLTKQPCPVKVGLREDYQAGDISTAAAREAAAVQLGIALALHDANYDAGAKDCQPDRACQVPTTPFTMTGPRSFTSIAATAFQGL